jgi:hypothetical protein
MPYRKTGFYVVPRTTYLPQMAADIVNAFGDKLDTNVAEIIRSLGRENVFLKSFLFDRLLTIKHPSLEGGDLRMKFIIILGDFLHSTGYLSENPVLIDYRDDPVYSADELLDLMLGTRLPTWKAADMMGDYATIDILLMFFTEVLRKYAMLLDERPYMADRFRKWIGSIGYKLLVNGGELSQAERSFFVVYCSTEPNTKGFISQLDSNNAKGNDIAPSESKDPLVLEIAALAQSLCLGGPSTAHMKLISNADLEQLIFYYGPHVPTVSTMIGNKTPYGDFMILNMTPADEISWQIESQLYGLMSNVQNFMIKSADLPPFAIKTPLPFIVTSINGSVCAYPDDPSFRIWLTDQKDCSNYTWDYPSTWRRRKINSLLDGGSMDYAIADIAVMKRAAGGMQVDMTQIPNQTLMWLTPAAAEWLSETSDSMSSMVEQIILPGKNGPEYRKVDLTAFYARFGRLQTTSAFADELRLPMDWFVQPNDAVVDFIASTMGLTLEERARYTRAIYISHNCAVYERISGRQAPIDALAIVKAQFGTAFNNA